MCEENTDLIREEISLFVAENPVSKRLFEEHEECIIEALQHVPSDELSKWITAIAGAAMGIGLLIQIIKNR